MYATLQSLRNTVMWALCLNLCDVSRQALEERVLASSPWLSDLIEAMLKEMASFPEPAMGLVKRLVLVDGSVFARPSSHGIEWRLHLSWNPYQGQPIDLMLSDVSQGEQFDFLRLQPHDLAIADRGYGIWRNILTVFEARAYFIFRLAWSNLTLLQLDGSPFDVVAWLEELPDDQEVAVIQVVCANDPQRRPLRLVVGRLPQEKAQEAQQKVYRQARKEKRPPQPKTLISAQFCILLSNLPLAISPTTILALYRLRWQIEWCFRRWKSWCKLKELPAYPTKIAYPVLLAKLLIILLLQRQLGYLPYQHWWTTEQPQPVHSSLVQLAYEYVVHLIRPQQALARLFDDPLLFQRHLKPAKRNPALQLQQALLLLDQLLQHV